MEQIASLHNHSLWSDGVAPPGDMISAARDFGLGALGISDHFIIRPDGSTHPWSISPPRLPRYIAEIIELKDSWNGLLLGLEVDWFADGRQLIEEALNGYPFDYLIGSVHEIDQFVLDGCAADWEIYSADEQDELHKRYWEAVASMAESRLFDIVGHLDLSKKFGHRPLADLGAVVGKALDAIAGADMVVELNTAGWFKPCAEAYPSADLLSACHERGIPVMLAADAHQPSHVVRAFDRGADLLASVGYNEVATFYERKREVVPLG